MMVSAKQQLQSKTKIMDLLQLILDQNRVNESQNLSHQTEKVQSNHHFSNPRLSFESDLIP